MNIKLIVIIVLVSSLFTSCKDDKYEKKGFQVSEIIEDENGDKVVGLHIDSLKLETRPRNVLLTKHPEHRITPIYKVNYHKKTKKPFTGSNNYHNSWGYDRLEGSNWNHNFMPGFEAVYGYNFINISHYNNKTKTENKLFEKPVLIKTFYFPAFSNDTLNFQPVQRDYYMVSVYDEDTNRDGYINVKDLRRLYVFDINAKNQRTLIPKNYSVMSSEYDSANDYMYIFAKADKNKNGQTEQEEPTDVFWIDLKNPDHTGIQYKTN